MFTLKLIRGCEEECFEISSYCIDRSGHMVSLQCFGPGVTDREYLGVWGGYQNRTSLDDNAEVVMTQVYIMNSSGATTSDARFYCLRVNPEE